MATDIKVAESVGASPYLVKYFGALEENGFYWILTEIMDICLDKFFKKAHSHECKRKMTEMIYSKIAFTVLSALVHLESKGYMHRDIKPSNILVNKNGEIKVCDFGVSGKIVKNVNGQDLARTQGKGSFSFMAVSHFIYKRLFIFKKKGT